MAEQIRQQQLAAALESRLDSQSLSAMQAALLLNQLNSGSKAAAAGGLSITPKEKTKASVQTNARKSKGRGRTRGRPASHLKNSPSSTTSDSQANRSGDKLNKNTVASLLAKSRELSGGATLTAYDLENAENPFSRPELTIEPIYRSSKSDSDQFDSSDNGRRFQSFMEDGKLKIKTISDSPEIRNLSDHEENYDGYESDELHTNTVSSSMNDLGATENDDGTSFILFNTIKLTEASANSLSSSSQQNSIAPSTINLATSTTTNTTNIPSMCPYLSLNSRFYSNQPIPFLKQSLLNLWLNIDVINW